eukprot:scaffold2327_cov149-Amphora_coffeaeformis.AAC.2
MIIEESIESVTIIHPQTSKPSPRHTKFQPKMTNLLLAVRFVTFSALAASSHAFSLSSSLCQRCRQKNVVTARTTTSSALMMAWDDASSSTAPTAVDRKSFLQTAVSLSMGAVLAAAPLAAHADVTNKVASSAALRTVKLSQKKFLGLETVVQANDYAELKEALRVTPFSDIRKAMSTLIRGSEDRPEGEILQTKYKTFIARLEKMDGTAGQALRGKKLKEGELLAQYQETTEALADFLETAQAAVEIPYQSAEEAS